MNRHVSRRSLLCRLALALPAASMTGLARADASYTQRVVRLVIPFAPGGSADAAARILAEKLAEMWGQPVILLNRPGAGTSVASAYVAQAPADGYTLLMGYVLSYSTTASLYKKLSYDPATSLTPLSLVSDAPFIVGVDPSTGIKTLEGLVAAIRRSPHGLNYASSGTGAGPHLTTEMLLRRLGVRSNHVPYRGTAEVVTAVISGQVQFSVFDASALPQIRSGRIHALALTASTRWNQLPDLPTVAELGYPDFNVTSGGGIMVSSKTPDSIQQKIERDVMHAMSSELVRQRFAALGFVPVGSRASEFAEILRSNMQRIRALIDELGISAD